MAEGRMVQLHPHRSGLSIPTTSGRKQKVGDDLSPLNRLNVMHFWEASSPMWKRTASGLALAFAVVVFFSADTLGPALICVLPLGLLAGLLVMAFLWTGLMMSRLGVPEMLASGRVLRRGDALEIKFRQPVKKDTEFPAVNFQLVLREWVRYKCGTDTCTAQYDNLIDVARFPDEKIMAGEAFYKEVRFKIPDDAIHSFNSDDNRLSWLILVDIEIRNFPDLKETYEIEVEAEVNLS